MMMRILLISLAAFFIGQSPSEAQIRLNVRPSNGSRALTVTVQPRAGSSLVGCKGQVQAALPGRSFQRVLAVPVIGSGVSFSAGDLSLLSRRAFGTRTVRVNFRFRGSCTGRRGIETRTSVSLRTAQGAGTVAFNAWRREVRQELLPLSVQLNRVLNGISFSNPLDLQNAKDGTNRIFVVEQGGRIYSVDLDDPNPQKTLFLDISGRLVSGGERGLLGLAFHPQFASNGFFYVNYTESSNGNTVIARFTAPGDHSTGDSSSEFQLLTVTQPFSNHNAGSLVFGPDGFLYIPLGDGGSGGDPQGNGQNLQALLGKVLRIDVNSTSAGKNYAIPASNPFVGNAQGVPEEIYAIGFRNPYRVSFDFPTSRLWVGDVGQGEIEEVDIVEAGKNYGWNRMEGSQCFPQSASCDRTGLTLPVTEYNHSEGRSITGGYVYRGTRIPALVGKYIFADFESGVIWQFTYDGAAGGLRERIFDTDLFVSSFGVDEGGDLYVVSYGDGGLYRFEAQ